jgi:hypothetical protein
MRRYSQLLAVVVVLLFFSGLDLYLFAAEHTTLTPKNWMTIFGALLAPLAAYRLHRRQAFDRRLVGLALWSLAFMAISLVSYTVSPSDVAVQELWDRLLAVLFLGMAGFAFITPETRKAAAVSAIVVALVTVGINAAELAGMDWFLMYVATRPSGLYLNANSCGAALVTGMIVGSPLVARRLRLSFYLLVGAGVAMTFSRSTIVGWLIAAPIMVMFDSTRARARELVLGSGAAAVLMLVLFFGAGASGLVGGFRLDDNLLNRVSFFRTFEASDDAAQQRKEVAAKAWMIFAARPLRGNGTASTRVWSEPISTHNIFLTLMADHGILGALILPALLLCVFLGRPREAAGPHWAFCLFTLWLAFFSHNILTEPCQLLAFAFLAMGGTRAAAAAPVWLPQGSRSVESAADHAFSAVAAQ